jgi:hypothetical protein
MPPATRRTRSANPNLPLILFAVAGGVGLLLVSVIVGAVMFRAVAPAGGGDQVVMIDPGQVPPVVVQPANLVGPRAEKEGAEWNYQELLTHLKTQGVPWEMSSDRNGFNVYFHEPRFNVPEMLENARNMSVRPNDLFVMGDDCKAVRVRQCRTLQEARDAAGGNDSYYWGRFAFTTADTFKMDTLKTLLPR